MRLRILILALIAASAPLALAQEAPSQDYIVYVVCESADKIEKIRFGPGGAKIEKEISVGMIPVNPGGPHGIAFSPDRKFYYVSLGHGRPFGTALKFDAATDKILGQVSLGYFPATADVSPDGNYVFIVNFNLHGDMVPSSVSAVVADEMIEAKRITTCTMPHGSRFNPAGTRHYSACMMDDMLVEIDTESLRVSRHFLLTKGKEHGMEGAPHLAVGEHASHDMGAHGSEPPKPGDVSCSPTWAQPSTDGKFIYVACNKSSEIVEIDVREWKISRRLSAGAGVYNLAVSKDGKLVATNKRDQSVSIFDLQSGKELARLPTQRKVVHGAVVTPDSRYAFVSVEGIGTEPGTVEVIDLKLLKTVARVDTPPQAAGIDFARIEPKM
ncbi:MAG: YncE family protein [Acidobacteria bacterium]|nr:YncE family protein [Acidobacteriota bacterium]